MKETDCLLPKIHIFGHVTHFHWFDFHTQFLGKWLRIALVQWWRLNAGISAREEENKTWWLSVAGLSFPSPQTTSYPPHAPFPMSLPPLPLHTAPSQAFSLSSLMHFIVLISYLLLLPHPMDLPSDKVIHPPLQTDCQCWFQFLLRCVVDEAVKPTGSVNCTLCPQCCSHIHSPP